MREERQIEVERKTETRRKENTENQAQTGNADTQEHIRLDVYLNVPLFNCTNCDCSSQREASASEGVSLFSTGSIMAPEGPPCALH